MYIAQKVRAKLRFENTTAMSPSRMINHFEESFLTISKLFVRAKF